MDHSRQALTAPALDERHREPRLRTRLEVGYEDAVRQVFLQSRDLSQTGAYLLSPELPPVGARATLVLDLPDRAPILRIEAQVTRADRGRESGFALRFDLESLSAHCQAALRAFVLRGLPLGG